MGIGDRDVYVAREARGKGHGEAALRGRLAAERTRLHTLSRRVFVENVARRHLHIRRSFREVCVYLGRARLDGV